MFFRPQDLTNDFKAFKNGDMDGLSAILKLERERLFDYVMRMTGQLAKSAEVTEETLSSIEQSADDSDSLQELLILIYKTARKFAIDVWSAETPKLENSAYAGAQGKDIQNLIVLEGLIRSLPPLQREVLLLKERFGFAVDEVSEISGLASSDVELFFAQAMGALERNAPALEQHLPELIGRLSLFERPKYDGPETQNLSLIMNDFRKTNGLASNPWRWARFTAYLIIVVLILTFRDELMGFYLESIQPHLQSFFISPETGI